MTRRTAIVQGTLLALSLTMARGLWAHQEPESALTPARSSQARTTLAQAPIVAPLAPGANPQAVSGEGKLKFRVFLTSEKLPDEARKVLRSAHGGFAVDYRPGKGETYFALPGAGILQISGDMQTIRILPTDDAMKNVNLHNTTIWYAPDGTAYLVFPANDAGKVFTTTIDGKLLHTLDAPAPGQNLGNPTANDYFTAKKKFAPTGVAYLDGRYYVTTGYSDLDFVLTAQVTTDPLVAVWHDLAFGGKGNGPGQFGTGHSVRVPPGLRRIDVADRPHARIERFTPEGQYLSSLGLPQGSLSCDIEYLGKYAIVPSLDGPDKTKGAPIYILENDQLVSTIMPKDELGLVNFQHIHNAVLREVGGKLYIIAQAWNPGDFVILEQVTE